MNRAKNCFIFKDLLIRKKNKPLCFLKVLGAQSSLLTWKGMSRWASKSSLFQMFLLVLLCRCRSELWESIQLSLAQLWPEAGGTWWLFCAMTMLRGWCHRQEFSPIKKALKRTHVIFNHDLWTLWKFLALKLGDSRIPQTLNSNGTHFALGTAICRSEETMSCQTSFSDELTGYLCQCQAPHQADDDGIRDVAFHP